MADNNRRNRPSSGYGSNDNFNWEEYDMKTSSASGAPRRRRQAYGLHSLLRFLW